MVENNKNIINMQGIANYKKNLIKQNSKAMEKISNCLVCQNYTFRKTRKSLYEEKIKAIGLVC